MTLIILMMLLLTAAKLLVVAGITITLAGAAIGTAILFGCYILAAARNPEEAENLFNTTLMGFALVETFVFFSILIAGLTFVLV